LNLHQDAVSSGMDPITLLGIAMELKMNTMVKQIHLKNIKSQVLTQFLLN
jgi:hypothetical protein